MRDLEVDLATIRIHRYDPTVDAEPWYQVIEGVPYQGLSVLDVLRHVFYHMDPSLSFWQMCGKGSCGACAMVVNGRPVLACSQPAGREMVIEPHFKFHVVKDLLVDFSRAATGFCSPGGVVQVLIDPARCIHCQDCVRLCPVGVYGVVKKRVAVLDQGSCLGTTCMHCAQSCWKSAITIISSA